VHPGPYVYPPAIIYHPATTTVTGCLLVLHGAIGMLAALVCRSYDQIKLGTRVFLVATLLDWLWLLSILGLSQPGLGHVKPTGPASAIQSLCLAITLLPAYFAYELSAIERK
jgi:hypothetical protein